MKRGRIKLAFYVAAFSLSLYSASRILDPILALASGDTSKTDSGFLQKLLPNLTGGSDILESLASINENTQNPLGRLSEITQNLDPQNNKNTNPSSTPTTASDPLNALKKIANPKTPANISSKARITKKKKPSPQKQNPANPAQMKPKQPRKLKPKIEQSLGRSAVALHNQGKLKKAIAAYKKAIAADFKNASLHKNIAIAYYQVGNYELAWAEIHSAQKLGGRIPPKFLSTLQEKMPDPDV